MKNEKDKLSPQPKIEPMAAHCYTVDISIDGLTLVVNRSYWSVATSYVPRRVESCVNSLLSILCYSLVTKYSTGPLGLR